MQPREPKTSDVTPHAPLRVLTAFAERPCRREGRTSNCGWCCSGTWSRRVEASPMELSNLDSGLRSTESRAEPALGVVWVRPAVTVFCAEEARVGGLLPWPSESEPEDKALGGVALQGGSCWPNLGLHCQVPAAYRHHVVALFFFKKKNTYKHTGMHAQHNCSRAVSRKYLLASLLCDFPFSFAATRASGSFFLASRGPSLPH